MARTKVYDTATQSWVYADKSFGKDGTSVTVASVVESTVDGGSNVVTFSDGKTVTIKNGKTGLQGMNGAAFFVVNSEPMENPDTEKLEFIEVDFVGPTGRKIAAGDLIFCRINNTMYQVISIPGVTTVEVVLVGNLKGDKGNPGKDGHTPVVGTDYFTPTDKADIVAQVKASLVTETWIFTLEDGSTVEKEVLLG